MSLAIERESGIEFDFRAASANSRKHDAVNRCWPGVDFELEDGSGEWVWLEIKNWEPASLPPKFRGGQQRSFLCKMRSDHFFKEMRGKFLGASTFLSLTGQHPTSKVVYVLLIESPKLSSAIKSHAMTRMRGLIPNRRGKRQAWAVPIHVVVMDLADWNGYFPMYPATVV